MKKRTFINICIVSLLLTGAIWFFAFRKKEQPATLITEKPKYGYIAASVTATGTIQPVDTVAVGTQVSGTIKKIFVDFNSAVKKGQLLAQLDQSLLLAQDQEISANLQLSQSNLTYQQANFNRETELYNGSVISRAEYETAENQYKSAKDNLNSVAAQLRASQKNLSFTNIFSPIDGTVLSRNISEGQTVASSFSTPTLFSIAKDLTKMQVRASVDEADIANVKHGEQVTFTVDAFPDNIFKGTVEEIRLQPSISSNVVTYTTIINAPNDDMKLKPGMTANIIIYTNEETNALLIRATAIKFTPDASLEKMINRDEQSSTANGEQNKDTVKRLSQNNSHNQRQQDDKNNYAPYKTALVWEKIGDSIVQKRILIGLDDDVNIQVISGLSDSDEIVTGVNMGKEQKNVSKSSNRSPFMPARPGQNNSSGGSRKS